MKVRLALLLPFLATPSTGFAEHSFMEACRKGFHEQNPGFATVAFLTASVRKNACADALPELGRRTDFDLSRAKHLRSLEPLWDFTQLVLLDVQGSIESLRGIYRLQQLKELSIEVKLDALSFADVVRLQHLHKLRIMGQRTLLALDWTLLTHLRQLKVLQLARAKIETLDFLSALPPGLEHLDLSENQIRRWPAFHLPSVRFLTLAGNDLESLENLDSLTNLQLLDLRGNPRITPTQVGELARRLPQTKITL